MTSKIDNALIHQDEYVKNIHEYNKTHKPHVCILAPCFGSMCFVNFVLCLIQTKDLFQHFGIDLTIEFCKGDSLISRARNNLIAKAMNNPNITHIMFIDNDITWNPFDIINLLLSQKEVIGGIYPLKNYNWERLLPNEKNINPIHTLLDKKNRSQLQSNITDQDCIQNSLLKYNVNYLSREVHIEQNLTQVKHIATGFMMIQRHVIETMSAKYKETKYTDDVHFLNTEENRFAYALFDCGVEDDHYLSEDWMFCNRWTRLGGSIWVDVSINLSHTGYEDYKGNFMSSLIT